MNIKSAWDIVFILTNNPSFCGIKNKKQKTKNRFFRTLKGIENWSEKAELEMWGIKQQKEIREKQTLVRVRMGGPITGGFEKSGLKHGMLFLELYSKMNSRTYTRRSLLLEGVYVWHFPLLFSSEPIRICRVLIHRISAMNELEQNRILRTTI